SAGPANGFAFLVAGGTQLAVPLPAPWSSCLLLASPDATAGFLLDGGGLAAVSLVVPATPGLLAFVQAVTLDLTPSLPLDASNGLRIENDY
ncbi:MAG TPA: hypothetical protein VFZ65_15050, partial [Planctomycetota bacterium]|nr:hypothetical protein [Planctomycetota bacterium]